MTAVRLHTYLAPGIPLAFFRVLADAIGSDTLVTSDERASGPSAGETDVFTAGLADVGFMCAPAYLAMRRSSAKPVVELLGMAPVFDDPRAAGKPTYFADVVVRLDDPATDFAALAGRCVGFNDPISLSGKLALLLHLAGLGKDLSFFSSAVATGSHDASLRALSAGTIDVATIDASTLRMRRAANDPLAMAVRVVTGLGPHPIQPIVVRRGLPETVRARVRAAWHQLASSDRGRGSLSPFGCIGFASVDDGAYDVLDHGLALLCETVGQNR